MGLRMAGLRPVRASHSSAPSSVTDERKPTFPSEMLRTSGRRLPSRRSGARSHSSEGWSSLACGSGCRGGIPSSKETTDAPASSKRRRSRRKRAPPPRLPTQTSPTSTEPGRAKRPRSGRHLDGDEDSVQSLHTEPAERGRPAGRRLHLPFPARPPPSTSQLARTSRLPPADIEEAKTGSSGGFVCIPRTVRARTAL